VDAPATTSDALALWPDADTVPADTLTLLLDTAWEQCERYVPADELTPQPATPPHRWVQANVLAARDLWTAYRRDGDVLGFDNYAVTVRPLSSTVRQLLRPARGVPGVA
jgi:hypothetical protein